MLLTRRRRNILKGRVLSAHQKKEHNGYPYGPTELISTLEKFKSLVKLNGEETEAEFIVISGKGRSLLGRKTALELGVFKARTTSEQH